MHKLWLLITTKAYQTIKWTLIYVPTLNPVQILGNVLLTNTDFPLQPSGGTSTHFFILLLWSVIDLMLQWLFSGYSKCLPHKNFHLLITFSVVFQFVFDTKKWYHISLFLSPDIGPLPVFTSEHFFYKTKCCHLSTIFVTICKNYALWLIGFKNCTSQVSGTSFKSMMSEIQGKNAIHPVTSSYVLVTCDSNIMIIKWICFWADYLKEALLYKNVAYLLLNKQQTYLTSDSTKNWFTKLSSWSIAE